MKIIGIGYIPSSIKWIMDYIIESFGEEVMKDSIEIWGTKSDGYNIEFKLFSTGMIFEMSIEGKYFIISATLLECSTPERKYILKKWGLEIGFKEAITRMKVLMIDELDSILKKK